MFDLDEKYELVPDDEWNFEESDRDGQSESDESEEESEKLSQDEYLPSPEKNMRRDISENQLKAALMYYRSPKKGYRSLPAMKIRHRWIKGEEDMKMIRR